jgi:hypothetical protein
MFGQPDTRVADNSGGVLKGCAAALRSSRPLRNESEEDALFYAVLPAEQWEKI